MLRRLTAEHARQHVKVMALGAAWACALLVLAPAASARPTAPAATRASEVVVMLDLRPGDPAALTSSRHALQADLARVNGLDPEVGPELDAALAGVVTDGAEVAARAELDRARTAFGALDCAEAVRAVGRALPALAARQASGDADLLPLRTAWTYRLVCADQAGAPLRADAMAAAAQLRTLGAHRADDVGVPPALWDRYPEIDATLDRDVVAVAVEVAPELAGAEVWLDHRRVGPAPRQVFVSAGPHVLAVAGPSAAGALEFTAGASAMTVTVPAAPRLTGPWATLAAQVAAWRAGGPGPTGAELGALLGATGSRVVLVLAGQRTVEIWARSAKVGPARRVDRAAIDQPMELGAVIVDQVASWDQRGPEAGVALLREGDHPATGRRIDPVRWWVYASIIGAAALGAVAIYASESAEDVQHIRITGP